MEIKIKDIRILRNIRTELGDVSNLMTSIRENGLLEPLGVCEIKGEYILAYGHRRFSALKKLGRKSLILGKEIIIVDKDSNQDLLIFNMIENFHRKENTPLEFAKASSDLREMGLTTAEIAVRLSTNKSRILTALKLLEAVPKEERKNVSYGGQGVNNKKGKLPANVASAIVDSQKRFKLSAEEIEKLFKIAREEELSTPDIRLIGVGIKDGLTFSEAINLLGKYKVVYTNFIVDRKEFIKIKISFKKYIKSVLKGKEKFNQKLLY